jgi:adenylate kinase family enzyme
MRYNTQKRKGRRAVKKGIVIGCPGSGKTTFAERLCRKTGLPLYHLDAIWHRADRTHISREEFDRLLGEILGRESWIVDGNYSRTLERRLLACDTVMLFDLPTETCLAGAVARLGKKRPDMPWVDTELDPRLGEEIENFRSETLPEILALLEQYREGRRIEIFRSREEADAFLEAFEKRSEQ